MSKKRRAFLKSATGLAAGCGAGEALAPSP